jgi:hypothetical protein
MLNAHYFDGRSTRVRAVSLTVVDEDLVIAGEDINFRVPFSHVKVDERLGRAPRRLRFENGTFCEVRDLEALDTLLSSTMHRDGWVDRMQRHVPFVLSSIVVCVLLAVAAYKWGLPWAAAKGALPAAGNWQNIVRADVEVFGRHTSHAEQDRRGTPAGAERQIPCTTAPGDRRSEFSVVVP